MEAVHHLPGIITTGHHFSVPLDYSGSTQEHINVFAREVVAVGKHKTDLPWLLFLQGGPGFPSPRPDSSNGWIKRALQDHRVLLLDQRGTGRSTPLTHQTLARLPSPQAQADYLKHFRADSIVQDAEHIRKHFLGEDQPWSVLGQSFGGFCLTHYLSVAPQGLREAIFTGGLPPLNGTADDVYRATYQRVMGQNRRFYERYPDAVERIHEIVAYLTDHEVHLPGSGRLTPRRFQQLGIEFGFSGGFEKIHYLIEEAFIYGAQGRELSYAFLRGIENIQSFETNPLYVVLHEAIYCQEQASHWAANRVRQEFPEFDIHADQPVFFTGEMVFPWMCEEYAYLRPLKDATDLVAAYDGWPRLYDSTVLQQNTVPAVAAIYYDDMYVERHFSEQTAQAIQGIKLWVTNEYDHSGLRMNGEQILDRLLRMLKGEI